MAFVYRGRKISRVGFIGFGRSGEGVYTYLSKKYPELEFTVRSEKMPERHPQGAALYLGDRQLKELSEDILFLSPTARRDREEITRASTSGTLISSDAEFFFDNSGTELYAVTGSDGKSTTATLAAALIGKAKAIGNIGEAMTPHLDDRESTAYVAELSSFQLMDFEPKTKRAAITTLTPNHLDWHRSYEEYAAAKENVLKRTREPILSLDCEALIPMVKSYGSFALFSTRLTLTDMKKYGAELNFHVEGGALALNGEPIAPLTEFKRCEEYNIRNFMAALALSYGSFDTEAAKELARGFSGLSHRCELFASFSGIDFYDSSIDSSPERTRATLTAFGKAAAVVLGGKSKGLDYRLLRDTFDGSGLIAVITGENREEIKSALCSAACEIFCEADFENAVLLGAELAKKTGALILSPASTSFDRFRNFEERGKRFKEIIFKLKENR